MSRPVTLARSRGTGTGQKRMIWTAGAILFALALLNHAQAGGAERGALWRVLLAIGGFLYLWWLASLLFDLVFVWHRYIQGDVALQFLRREVQSPHRASKEEPPPEDSPGGSTAVLPPTAPAGAPTKIDLHLTVELSPEGRVTGIRNQPASSSASRPARASAEANSF
jgi:hypothetical protein